MSEVIEKAAELVDRAEINASGVLVEYSRTEAALASLRERYAGAKFDLTTTAGDKAARAARLDLVTLRTGLEKKRKELKAPAVEFGKKIDDEAKRITAEIVALEDPIDAQIKADETRRENERLERERIAAERAAGFRAKIEAIRACVTKAQGLTSERIGNGIAQIEAIVTDETTWAEFAEEAAQAKSSTLAAMLNLRDQAKTREDEAARLEAQRIENERIAAEQAAQAERLAAQQRALDEQAAKIAAQQKAIDDANAEAERKVREANEAEARQRQEEADMRARDEQARAERDAALQAQGAGADLSAAAPTENPATARVCEEFAPASPPAAAPAQAASGPTPVVRQIHPATQALRNEQPTVKLGQINEMLAPFSISTAGLAELGFAATMVKGASLYRESDLEIIREAAIACLARADMRVAVAA